MISAAIVEDKQEEAEALMAYLTRFENETGEHFNIDVYSDGLAFLDGYKHSHDVIFMDIEMPHLSGMDTARRLRKLNEEVPLVFVTNMKQYAIEGYAVAALDFILKPVNYYRLASILKKISKEVQKRSVDKLVRTNDGVVQVKLDSVYYVEVMGRDILYHTEWGNICTHGKLKDLEEEFAPYGFVRCSNCYLVNLRHVKGVNKDVVSVGNTKLPVSQRKRKDLLRAMGLYLGEK